MNNFSELTELLIKNNLTISAAESCTGGLFAAGIISVSDASKVIRESYVTYSEESKIRILGVKPETIERFSVVSEETALEMALGVKRVSGSDISVGITGYAGPASSSDDADVGKVCFGFTVGNITVSATKEFGDIGRNIVRELACAYAVKTLIGIISRYYPSND